MSTVFSFQTQLISIMDALSKTAVIEISKLVDIESKMLKIEINRGRNEIASLTEKLQLMEKLLYMAQGGRQDAVASACMVRDGSEDRMFAPERTRPAIKSEGRWERITSSNERSSLHQVEEPTVAEAPSSPSGQTEMIMVKEEPPELSNGDTEQEGTNENRLEELLDSQKTPDDIHHPKPATDHPQPLFSCFVNIASQSSPSRPGRKETEWNPQLRSAHTTVEADKTSAQNIVSQSSSVLRNTKLHNLRNSAAKRFGCLQCGKGFRCFSQLEIHQRSHTGEKPFRCTLCGKRYAQKGHLYTHQRTHTGEKPYRCPICGKGFIQKCTLDMHQRTHTGEKPFVCIKCGKGFTKNCNLKKHLAVHLDPSLNMFSTESSAPTFSTTFINGAT